MDIIVDQKLRERISKMFYKQCPLCGRDIFASDDFVYTKHKQGETIMHKDCYLKLIKRGKKKNGF